ncbi:MAG TPA: hypothetical protein VJQ84_11195 [Solirubrobacterales bacterium]|nr:hypothetical protein [Solirubrobacterales bacterium]
MSARCGVCEAPALPPRCPFCRSGLAAGPAAEPQAVLDHLAETIPGAEVHHGAFDRGPVRELKLFGVFSARFRRGSLELEPAEPLESWIEALLTDLRRRAQSDFELRRSLTRRGWALR